MIKIRGFSFSLYNFLIGLWFFQWIHKYQPNIKTKKLLVYLCLILVSLTCFISIPILINIYLGALMFKHKIFQKFHLKISNHFHRNYKTKFHNFIGILFSIFYVIFWLFILSLVFTIPIILLLGLGYKIEKKREFPKMKKIKNFTFQYNEFEKNKQESKTIGYLND